MRDIRRSVLAGHVNRHGVHRSAIDRRAISLPKDWLWKDPCWMKTAARSVGWVAYPRLWSISVVVRFFRLFFVGVSFMLSFGGSSRVKLGDRVRLNDFVAVIDGESVWLWLTWFNGWGNRTTSAEDAVAEDWMELLISQSRERRNIEVCPPFFCAASAAIHALHSPAINGKKNHDCATICVFDWPRSDFDRMIGEKQWFLFERKNCTSRKRNISPNYPNTVDVTVVNPTNRKENISH